jgi:WD40 repeat protein
MGLMLATTGCLPATVDDPLTLSGTIALEGVSGRIDHMTLDAKGNRLFVACLGNNTVEVIDLAAGKRDGTIGGLSEPQGVLFVPEFNRIVVANGGDATVRFYDGKTLQQVKTIDFKEDADNLRYEPAAKRIYVGYGRGAIGVLNAETGERIADIKLPGHPESFQLETHGRRIFVNVPTAHQIAVIDRQRAVVVASWPLKDVRSNFPMALDEADHRLFIGCRSPAKLLVLDTESGSVVTTLDCAGDVDDVFYDRISKRIYLSGGEGRVDVFKQLDADHYTRVSQTATATGARTCFLGPEMKALYVALPKLLVRGAEIRVFRTP